MLIRVGLEGTKAVLNAYAGLPAQIARAQRRTIRKGTQFAARQTIRQLAAAHGIPQRVLRQRRRVTASPDKGFVFIGVLPIALIHLAARQNKKGVRAGGQQYDHAFISQMPSSHTGVFRRKGRSRLPIRELVLQLNQSVAVVENVRDQTAARIPTILDQELNYEINVRGGRGNN